MYARESHESCTAPEERRGRGGEEEGRRRGGEESKQWKRIREGEEGGEFLDIYQLNFLF